MKQIYFQNYASYPFYKKNYLFRIYFIISLNAWIQILECKNQIFENFKSSKKSRNESSLICYKKYIR